MKPTTPEVSMPSDLRQPYPIIIIGVVVPLFGAAWSMGALVGPLLGGSLSHPAERYPARFGDTNVFVDFVSLVDRILYYEFRAKTHRSRLALLAALPRLSPDHLGCDSMLLCIP